ncbi:D-aminoacyl-tRNA deacylase, partial [Bienertia sinuspersici]
AQTMLSEIYPGGFPKVGSTYWDQIREVALVSVARHLLKRLRELLEQDNSATLQAVLSGEMNITSYQQGHRDRTLALLHQMIEDAHMGKRQFLSGKLHNLAKVITDEEAGKDFSKVEGREPKFPFDFESNSFVGLGLRTGKRPSFSSASGEGNAQPFVYDTKDVEKRLFGPLSTKQPTYLSQFILHIAAIGDIVDGTDTTHDFNYFSVLYEWPKDVSLLFLGSKLFIAFYETSWIPCRHHQGGKVAGRVRAFRFVTEEEQVWDATIDDPIREPQRSGSRLFPDLDERTRSRFVRDCNLAHGETCVYCDSLLFYFFCFFIQLVTRLVFERGSTDAAEKVADIMSADFVHEVISACVPPVYPSRFGHGWACIPLVESSAKSVRANHSLTSCVKVACPSHVSSSLASAGIAQYHLQLDIIKHLVKISPVRAVLACVFGSTILYSSKESSILSSLDEESMHSPDTNRMFYEFALDQSERFPTLNRWIQMQTNLHRVSEFAITSKDTDDVGGIQINRKASVKRPREPDADNESEIDDNTGSNAMPSAPEVAQITADHETVQDSMKYQVAEEESTTFLTFDWENEEPYESTVKRFRLSPKT